MSDGNKNVHEIIIFKLDTLQKCISEEIKPKLDEIQEKASKSNIIIERNTTNVKWLTWVTRLVVVGIITSSFFIYRNFSINKCMAKEKIKIEGSKK